MRSGALAHSVTKSDNFNSVNRIRIIKKDTLLDQAFVSTVGKTQITPPNCMISPQKSENANVLTQTLHLLFKNVSFYCLFAYQKFRI